MTTKDLIISSSNCDVFPKRVFVPGKTKEKFNVFERFTPIYLQMAYKYRPLLKKVWRSDVDFGIDFLAETSDRHTIITYNPTYNEMESKDTVIVG